jgi:hypothetical protein
MIQVSSTPSFPAWKCLLAPMRQKLTKTIQQVRACTLCQLEQRFASCLPDLLFAKAPSGPNSRDCTYTLQRTFWCFLWQCLNLGASGREVVRQLQALMTLQGAGPISSEDGAYCTARQRLPESLLTSALTKLAQACESAAPATGFLQGRPVKVVDGTVLTLADTPDNQAEYPQVSTMKKGCAFPLLKVVAVFSMLSGAIEAVRGGALHVSEFQLLYQLASFFRPDDIVLGDRGFGNCSILAWLQSLKVDFIARSDRQVDGRRRQERLGKNDWIVVWQRKPTSSVVPDKIFGNLPEKIRVRIVRGSLYQRGFRVRKVTVVTTLLDPKLYPAADILQAYLRRWRMEMCLDDLKTTLKMNTLRCKSPAMVRKEMLMHLIAHNLVRYVMIQAVVEHGGTLEQLSFKGTLDAVRQFTHAMAQAGSKRKRQELWDYLLRTIASDKLPVRHGRREPRAVKYQPRSYDRLNQPRHQYQDRPKRNVRLTRARARQKAQKPANLNQNVI